MKKKFALLLAAGVIFLVARAFPSRPPGSAHSGTGPGEPGSVSDPLVTKSFLEKTYGWQVTIVQAGDRLPLDLGSEAVLRSGKAVVQGTASGGLADLTEGEDLSSDTIIPTNHYLICPASDGRGIQAITTSVLLTRGLVR